MSRFLGEIRQLGYVVPDIEKAMKYWTETMGVGPWFYNPKVPIEGYHYDGRQYEVHNSVVQVELIQTRNDAPSMYRDFQQAGHSGLQHVAYWTEDFDRDRATMEANGFKVKMGGEVGANGRFVYFDKEMHPGTVIELSEVVGPKGAMFRTIREAAQGWDGSDSIRPFPKLVEF